MMPVHTCQFVCGTESLLGMLHDSAQVKAVGKASSGSFNLLGSALEKPLTMYLSDCTLCTNLQNSFLDLCTIISSTSAVSVVSMIGLFSDKPRCDANCLVSSSGEERARNHVTHESEECMSLECDNGTAV